MRRESEVICQPCKDYDDVRLPLLVCSKAAYSMTLCVEPLTGVLSRLLHKKWWDWKPRLTCASFDAAGALKSHYKGAELDLGPDPKADEAPPAPAVPEAPKANGSAAPAEKDVLGLPS